MCTRAVEGEYNETSPALRRSSTVQCIRRTLPGLIKLGRTPRVLKLDGAVEVLVCRARRVCRLPPAALAACRKAQCV